MRRGLIIIMGLVSIMSFLYAGTTGKITGTVKDAQTGEPLMGANVVIVGQPRGAATDLDGNYLMLNIPPGIYDLRATMMGYDTLLVRNVQVLSDKTTVQNFELNATVIQAKEVEVVATRPPVEKDITATTSYVTSETIEQMPVQSVSEILTTRTGVIARGGSMHMRGGRGTEVAYLVNGMPVNDPVYGYRALDVSTNTIQEITTIVGSFNAEYGNAMSGVVNIVTKEGNPNKYSGSLVFRTDDLGFPQLNKYSRDADRIELTLSGPEPVTTSLLPLLGLELPRSKRISFFASFLQENTHTSLPYNRVYDFEKHEFTRETLKSPYLIDYSPRWGLFPERRSNEISLTLKLKQRLSPSISYSLGFIGEWSKWRSWDWDYYYTPSSAHLNEFTSRQVNLNLTHTISPTTFYELKIGNFYYDRIALPGGKTPADFNTAWYSRGEYLDDWTDLNGDGKPQVRLPWMDINNNGYWDVDEPWVAKVETLGIDTIIIIDDTPDTLWNIAYYDTIPPQPGEEPWWDWNNNWTWDPAWTNFPGDPLDMPEPFSDGEPFVDYGEEDSWIDADEDDYPDIGEWVDANHNGVLDFKNGVCDYYDLNGNGRYDIGEPGEEFTDLNGNGYYDFPNGKWDSWEHYFDINHNGKWDDTDGFYDRGFDQWAYWHHRTSNIWLAKFDLTSQLNRNNLLKTGLEFRWTRMIMREVQYPEYHYDKPPDGHEYEEHGIFRSFYTRTPKTAACYIQNKMEYGSLIANVGLRFDFTLQAPEVLVDSVKEEILYNLEGWEDELYTARVKVSPRLGISYPITDRSKLFFSYGHFYQLPGYDYYYQTPTQAAAAGRILGNPNLDYEKTVSYELGVAYAPTKFLTLTLSGYYKDIYNLLNTSRHRLGLTSPIVQDVYKNLDYGRSRGLELQIDKHYNNYWTLSFNYQFAYAYGKSSSNRSGYDARFDETAIPLRDMPLDWDRRHTINAVLDLRVRKGEHPSLLGLRLPDNWGMNILWQWGSGFPYTPDKKNPWVPEIMGQKSWERTNYLRLPNYSRIDMKINKDFSFKNIELSIFTQIDNLTNRRNVLNVHKETGLPDDSTIEDGWGNGKDHDKAPGNWSSGRGIEIGFEISF